MSYTEWLRRQVKQLENEIRVHPIFDSEVPANPEELRALRQTIVLHTFLKQQLLRRERVDVSIQDAEEAVSRPTALSRLRERVARSAG